MKSPSTISQSIVFGLHFAGIWPGTPYPGLHKVLWVTCMGICQTYQYKYVITRFRTESLIMLIDSFSIALPLTMVCIKLIVAWTHRGVLRDILSTMEEDCQKYAVIDTNNVISRTAAISYRVTSTILILYVSSVGFYAVGTFAFQNGNHSRELLLKMDLPFDINESPAYELVVTAQFLHQVASSITFGAFLGLLLIAVLHVGCQIDIICQRLTDISIKTKGQLQFFITRHQEIIVFIDRVEKFFTYIALSQLVVNTIITCTVGFLIVVSLKSENGVALLIKSVMFYIVICLEVFIYCFAGEYLNMKSKLIGDTVYESLWYDLQPSNCRQVVFLILRSQKGLTLTFGKFSVLSLESFTGVRHSCFIHDNIYFH
ncbi:Putative odorant receptor 13a [Dufourea novaeangliae]|uniref:Odorant receptor n=1 Tax=Dufourea novaeangliae TaxID=178035 RepID=A0A154NYL3_DUFNO|nr:Putative odorant receptor 13a [Dufourea novaeangliae]